MWPVRCSSFVSAHCNNYRYRLAPKWPNGLQHSAYWHGNATIFVGCCCCCCCCSASVDCWTSFTGQRQLLYLIIRQTIRRLAVLAYPSLSGRPTLIYSVTLRPSRSKLSATLQRGRSVICEMWSAETPMIYGACDLPTENPAFNARDILTTAETWVLVFHFDRKPPSVERGCNIIRVSRSQSRGRGSD